MITSAVFRGRRYAVLGLARSGLASVEALVASGASVTAWDNREEARDAARDAASKILPGTGRGTMRSMVEGARSETQPPLHHPAAPDGPPPRPGEELFNIANLLETDLSGYDGIVVSPGVPLNRHPITAQAAAAGVPIVGDIELFAQARRTLPPHRVVGVTGTNGKSTTTALIHHIARAAGMPATMAGNIGYPIMGQDPLAAGGLYVLELSSYQIDLTFSLDCDVAVLLNVTPDHLDRYDGVEAYAASKARLFALQSPDHAAVIATEDSYTLAIADRVTNRRLLVSSADVQDQSRWPALQGPHNAQNVAAAVAAARALGIDDAVIAGALETYRSLPHRMEFVAEKHGVRFVNDSKATNTESAAPALASYPAVHWIVGGLAKTEDLGPCEDQLGHVRAAYTIGEAGPMFARLLEGRVPVRESELLITAVQDASAAATPGEVVLLSPACASFDQFRDYEARGDAFKAAVEALA